MANEYTNKVIINGSVVLDVSQDTVTEADLKKGVTAHDKAGAPIVGTSTYDADTSDADVSESEILSGKIAYGYGGVRLVGSMPNNAENDVEIAELDGTPIPRGYYDGSGKAQLSEAEKEKIVPGNIREGITILGITGTHSGETHIEAETKTATPSFVEQKIMPSEGKYLSEVTVEPIPVTYADNGAGGQTCTVG